MVAPGPRALPAEAGSRTTGKRLVAAAILAAYCAVLIKVMVFKDMPTVRIGQLMLNFAGTDTGHGPNFVPFRTILPYLLGDKGWIIAGVNLAGNILLLVPVGFLVPLVRPAMGWKGALGLAIAAGLVIEAMQTALRVGIFDIDDVILNALGVMVGYWAFASVAASVRARHYGRLVLAAAVIVVTAAGAFYAIYPKEQLIGPPGDPGIRAEDEGPIPEGGDLCGGTGGTGEIIAIGDHAITIRRQDGFVQNITLTARTVIRTSAGPAVEAELRIGDRVTLVVEVSDMATTVLLCQSG